MAVIPYLVEQLLNSRKNLYMGVLGDLPLNFSWLQATELFAHSLIQRCHQLLRLMVPSTKLTSRSSWSLSDAYRLSQTSNQKLRVSLINFRLTGFAPWISWHEGQSGAALSSMPGPPSACGTMWWISTPRVWQRQLWKCASPSASVVLRMPAIRQTITL